MNIAGGEGSFGDSVYGMRYGGYEDPKSFEPYQLILLALDFLFNWIMDWAHTDPLAILVIFVFQCLGLIVSFIVYIMASASQAMQSGLRKTIVYHHQVNLLTWLIYIILTCSWYIWALRKSWPSVSDQFSFSFSSGSAFPVDETDDNSTTSSANLVNSTTTTTTISPLISTLVTESLSKSRTLKRLVKPEGRMEDLVKGVDKSVKEFYILWTSGFVALYVIQRTVAIIHYCVCLKATYFVLNASSIDKLNGSKYPDDRDNNSRLNNNRARNNNRGDPHGIEEDDGDSSEKSDLADERDWRNFRNSFEISKETKNRRKSSHGIVSLSESNVGGGGFRGRGDPFVPENNGPGTHRQKPRGTKKNSGN